MKRKMWLFDVIILSNFRKFVPFANKISLFELSHMLTMSRENTNQFLSQKDVSAKIIY